MKKSLSLLLGVAVLAVVSCQKTEELKPNSRGVAMDEAAAVRVVDGRLSFANQAAYDKTMKYLVGHQSELAAWEKQFEGYVSMRSAFESITTEQYEEMIERNLYDNYKDVVSVIPSGDEKEIVANIEDRVASTVVNNRGLVQIGSDVYKIGRDKVVKFSKYVAGMENQYNISNAAEGITVNAVKRTLFKSSAARGARPSDERNNSLEYWHNTSLRRLIGTVYDWDPGITEGVHIGLQTKHQRRLTGIWYAEAIPSINLSGSGSYQTYQNGVVIGGPTPFNTGPLSLGNENYLNYTIQYGGSNSYSYVSVTSTHSGTCKDNNFRTFTW